MYGKTKDKIISIVTLTILVVVILSNIDNVSGLSSSTKEQQAIIDNNNLDLIALPNTHILKLMDSKNNKTKRNEVEEDKPDPAITTTLCNDYKKNGGKPYVRDPYSCIRYYKCMQGVQREDERLVTIWFECDNGYAYNEDTGECDKKSTLPKCIIEKNSGISIILSPQPYLLIVTSWIVISLATLLFA